jgi:HK97 gp10 family phage protein
MNVEMRGMEQTKRVLLMVPPETTKGVVREIRRSTLNVQTGAKKRAPVDTARLRNSIATAYENNGLRGIVGTNVDYAPFVEWGTRRTRAQPFMHPAFEEEWPKFIARLRAAMGTDAVRSADRG